MSEQTEVQDDAEWSAEADDRELLPYSASIPLDRAAGGLLPRGKDQGNVPEGLLRQLQDPSVLEDTPLYWMRTVASNSSEDHYGTIMQTDSLKNYARDAEDGLPFCNSHRHDELPFGRTYAGRFFQSRGQHLARTEMDAYVPFDMNVNGVDTTHFIRAVRTGVARDVSISFKPEKIICSLDGRRMPLSLMDLLTADADDPSAPCRHVPGASYMIDGKRVRALGKVYGARCLELSPVYRGATPGASILSPSRALVVDERSAPPDWALHSPSLRTAALLAEASMLDRPTALALEEFTRGISFPDVTRRHWAGSGASELVEAVRTVVQPRDWISPVEVDDQLVSQLATLQGALRRYETPQESTMPRPAAEAAAVTDPSALQTRGAPASGEPTTESSPSSGSPTPDTAAETTSEQAEEEAPPPVRRTAAVETRVEPEGQLLEVQGVGFDTLRTALVQAGLAGEGFDGDPVAQIEIAGRRLEIERAWGTWGRRYRDELCADIEREGVRAFGPAAWTEARPAYEGTLKRGDAEELIALRKHFEHEAAQRGLKGGRQTRDTEEPTGRTGATTSSARPKIPAAAYRS